MAHTHIMVVGRRRDDGGIVFATVVRLSDVANTRATLDGGNVSGCVLPCHWLDWTTTMIPVRIVLILSMSPLLAIPLPPFVRYFGS